MLIVEKEKTMLALSVDDYRQWNELVSTSPTPDIYFRPGYAVAHADENTAALAVVLQTSKRRFLVPLLRRRLSSLSFVSGATDYDALTPYGYGGVLPLEEGRISDNDAVEFVGALREWCLKENIVSCMLRLHPLMEQSEEFGAMEEECAGVTLQRHGITKAIDLLSWDETLSAPRGMNKGRRSDLSFARRELSVSIVPCDTVEGLISMQTFREIYDETMRRIGASSYYFFSEEYYRILAQELAGKVGVAIARRGNDPVGGALFFADGLFGHYHLSGTTINGRDYKANTLVLVAGTAWARQKGCKWLHLGGGIKPDDSLYQFKSSFGSSSFCYSFLTIVANQTRYAELVELRSAATKLDLVQSNFFPLYRA